MIKSELLYSQILRIFQREKIILFLKTQILSLLALINKLVS